jgi:hypothetical protein
MKIEPSQCPTLSDCDIRELVRSLDQFDYVNIYHERTEHSEWEVEIHNGSVCIRKSSGWLLRALWAAVQESQTTWEQEYIEHNKKIKAALSKLTAEDKIILGLTK